MRVLKTLLLLAGLLPGGIASAGSIDPDLSKLVREAEKPKVLYGPARVGWNETRTLTDARVANPVYESLRLDSPAAIRAELKSLLIPDWQVLLAFAALIFGLRMLRAPAGEKEPANIIPFPTRPLPEQQEAA